MFLWLNSFKVLTSKHKNSTIIHNFRNSRSWKYYLLLNVFIKKILKHILKLTTETETLCYFHQTMLIFNCSCTDDKSIIFLFFNTRMVTISYQLVLTDIKTVVKYHSWVVLLIQDAEQGPATKKTSFVLI